MAAAEALRHPPRSSPAPPPPRSHPSPPLESRFQIPAAVPAAAASRRRRRRRSPRFALRPRLSRSVPPAASAPPRPLLPPPRPLQPSISAVSPAAVVPSGSASGANTPNPPAFARSPPRRRTPCTRASSAEPSARDVPPLDPPRRSTTSDRSVSTAIADARRSCPLERARPAAARAWRAPISRAPPRAHSSLCAARRSREPRRDAPCSWRVHACAVACGTCPSSATRTDEGAVGK